MVFVESAMSITYERMAGLKVDQDDGWFKSYQANIEDCYLTNLKKNGMHHDLFLGIFRTTLISI